MKLVKLIIIMLFSILFTVALVGAILFLPAGDYYWINGWMLIVSLVFYILLTFIYFMIKDPSTLEKRSKLSSDKGDNLYLTFIGILFLALLLLPTMDYRFGWSQIPSFVSWIGFAGLIFSLLIIFLVMRENSFASKGVMIHEDQKVIETGPYARVRHPMYLGAILMSISIPLTLGSWISIFPALLIPIIFALRIRKEEDLLLKELQGYDTYLKKVRYRLIPKIW